MRCCLLIRRCSQLKFAFFSPSFAEDGGTDEDEDDDERKRRLTFIFGIVGATLFVLAVLMVGIGLKMSSNADSNSKFPQPIDSFRIIVVW
jgi:hypothetical protein